jgi:hypothetical protein
MKTKHILIFSLVIISTFLAGRALGRYQSNLRVYENLPEAAKKEFHGMSKEELSRLVTQIKTYGDNTVTELSLIDLFRATTVVHVESIQRKGDEAVRRYIEEIKQKFLSSYQNGSSNYGEWKKVADGLALKLMKEKTEPNQPPEPTTKAITDAVVHSPRQP